MTCDRTTIEIANRRELDYNQTIATMSTGITEEPAAAERPLVSVIVPVYNGRTVLGRCVESLLAQTWPSVEVLVVEVVIKLHQH